MRYTITANGATHEVAEMGTLPDLVAFERHFGIPSTVLDKDDPTPGRAEWNVFLAYRALVKAKAIPSETSFDQAVEMIESIEAVEDAADPTTASAPQLAE